MKSVVSIAALAAVALAIESTNFNIDKALKARDNGNSGPNNGANTFNPCYLACGTLRNKYGTELLLEPRDDAYTNYTQSYWAAQQSEIHPGCVFKPQSAEDVSAAILASRQSGCPFAVKSGGHSAVPGGSNIENGVTISFERMNKTTISQDRKSVTFEPGQTWFQVYSQLEPQNITIIGGRAGGVGVGGLTLGGGISYFSSIYGLACDNVIEYELVNSSGTIINVNKDSYPDLFFALRGGGNNFGIVTKFTVNAIEKNPLMWGSTRVYPEAVFPALLSAYVNFGKNLAQDGKAHQSLSFVYAGPQIGNVANLELEYFDPAGNASIFAEYNAIDSRTVISNNTGVATLSQLTAAPAQTAGGNGRRQSFITWSVKLDLEMATTIKNIFFEELPSIINATSIQPSLALQVISEPTIKLTSVNGGNPLGLDPNEGPLMLVLINVQWKESRDDERIEAFNIRVKRRATDAALAAEKATDYIYMNYGNPSQDVISSYGSENKAKLLEIAKKYDPDAVFQKLQPGYFKLEGAPSDKTQQIN